MSQEKIALISLIVAIVGGMITLLNAMFPQLFPNIGNFLLRLKTHTWIIIILVLIIIVQQVFIFVKLKGYTA
jgi:uncharacterized protein involved in cysteine biosynthesis